MLTAANLSEEFWQRAERLTALRQTEQAQMQDYVQLQHGHMEFLIRALDGDPSLYHLPNLAPLSATVNAIVARDAVAFLRRKQFLRPANARLTSWEVMLFAISRWPWILWGSIQGAWVGVRKRDVAFKVTPKGDSGAKVLPLRYIVPMLVLAGLPAIAVALVPGGAASGYRVLCLISIFTYLIVPIAIITLHCRDNRRRREISGSGKPTWRERLPLGGAAAIATGCTTIFVVGLLAHTLGR